MAYDKNTADNPDDAANPESSILGPRKSPEEIRAMKKAEMQRKKWERQRKQPDSRRRRLLWLVIICVAVTAILCGVLIPVGLMGGGKDRDPKSGHFTRLEDVPEMSQEGIKGVVREAYYTKDGHLAVVLLLSNGLNTNHRMTYLHVSLTNENGLLIAEGSTDKINKDFVIGPLSTAQFTFYITPSDIRISDDDLDSLTYQIDTRGSVEDPSVLPTSTTAPQTDD